MADNINLIFLINQNIKRKRYESKNYHKKVILLIFRQLQPTLIPDNTSFISFTRSSLHFICRICNIRTRLATHPLIGIMMIMTAKPARTETPDKKLFGMSLDFYLLKVFKIKIIN